MEVMATIPIIELQQLILKLKSILIVNLLPIYRKKAEMSLRGRVMGFLLLEAIL